MITLLLATVCPAGLAQAQPGLSPPGLSPPGLIDRADDPPRPPGLIDTEQGHLPSYRAETLALDGLAVGAMLLAGHGNGVVGIAGLGTFLLGAPIVHARHGSATRAVTSLALRVGLPLAGGMIGARMFHGEDEEQVGGVILVGGIGALVAVVIDTAFLAGEQETRRPRTWTPTVRATRDGYTMGIGGAF